jgi:hypothetical protein
MSYISFADDNFLINALCGSTMMACLMSYMTASPFLYLEFLAVFKTLNGQLNS